MDLDNSNLKLEPSLTNSLDIFEKGEVRRNVILQVSFVLRIRANHPTPPAVPFLKQVALPNETFLTIIVSCM
jgi:hypothetical protein